MWHSFAPLCAPRVHPTYGERMYQTQLAVRSGIRVPVQQRLLLESWSSSWRMGSLQVVGSGHRTDSGVGQILQLQVAKRVMLQTDSWGRQSSSKSRCTTKCQGLCTLSNGRQWPAACVTCAHVIFWQWGFPTWSQWRACHFRGLLASLRRPAWRRRLGPAYVMDGGVQARLSSLGPLTEMVPGPIAE
jgi:hypothetical protein